MQLFKSGVFNLLESLVSCLVAHAAILILTPTVRFVIVQCLFNSPLQSARRFIDHDALVKKQCQNRRRSTKLRILRL